MDTFRVSDYRTAHATDDEVIQKCLDDAGQVPSRTIHFDEKNYVISGAILLPPDTTVLLDGCHITQADGTVDNVFRGANVIPDPGNPWGLPLACNKTKNIRIIGKNGARISGPLRNARAYHTTLHEVQDVVGDFWGWRTYSVCLSNCDGFELSGIFFDRSRGWTASFDRCINGSIHSIRLHTTCKNGDGIDLRSGCHHITVRGICGTTADDTVACTALDVSAAREYPIGKYLYPMEPCACLTDRTPFDLDISDIRIEDIRTNGNHHGVICLAADGHKVSDIHINRVVETAPQDGMKRESVVKIYTGFGSSCAVGDLDQIHVQNVLAFYADSALYSNTVLRSCSFRNIHHRNDGTGIRLADPQHTEIIDAIGKNEIQDMLRSLHIQSTDCVAMHISLKSIGKIDGGAEGLLAAMTDYLQDGLFVVPTHTWANVNRDHPVFNVLTTEPCVGVFASVCAKAANHAPNAVRSLHPTHSAAVFGKNCRAFAAGEEKLHSRTPRNGLWGRLYDEHAKVLLVGVGLERNTYIHEIDEEINGLPADEAAYFDAQVIDENGRTIKVPHMNVNAYWPSSQFVRFEKLLRDAGALTYASLGAAAVMCFDVQKGHDAIVALCHAAKETKIIAELFSR